MGNVFRAGASAVAAAAILLTFAGGPAQGVGPYKITGGSTAETHFTEKAFRLGDGAGGAVKKACDPAFLSSPANGLDGYVLDISSRARQTITIDYTLLGGPPAPTGVGSIQALTLSAGCTDIGAPKGTPGPAGPSSGSLSYSVPDGAKWLVINSTLTAAVNFSIR